MQPLETLVLYVLAGIAVAVAFLIRRQAELSRRIVLAIAAVAFWPLLLPVLLMPQQRERVNEDASSDSPSSRLRAAVAGLDGIAQDLAVPEIARVRAQATAITALEARLSEMDAMLTTPEFDVPAAERTLSELLHRRLPESDARVMSVRGRLRNIERLRFLRTRSADDLERICLQIEEITAQLKLLRFAGRATVDCEAVAAISQVADSIQSVTELLLQEGRGRESGLSVPA